MIAWLNRVLNPDPPPDSPEEIRRKMSTRCNAEIVARITNRAEIHARLGGYHARCSVLDLEAAERISKLERRIAMLEGRDASAFDDTVKRMLGILRDVGD